ncbi:MAG TPA: ABC transporter ATP-binding protein [Pseudomonadales bacterium]|nr:ABC transporter ATP-binding protein [Pseudomonadales bacterium]
MTDAVSCHQLCRQFHQGGQIIHGLDHVDLTVAPGEFICLTGPSGSGKTTLLNAIGGLDTPDSGRILVGGTLLNDLDQAALADLRLTHIGFVFQSYNLIPVLTAQENIEFILLMQGVAASERHRLATDMLREVGLQGLGARRPAELSGGQQQRVAVARAIVSKPTLVLADEPTANLDSHTAEQLMDLFTELNQRHGTTFIVASHDEKVQHFARRLIRMQDGKIMEDRPLARP